MEKLAYIRSFTFVLWPIDLICFYKFLFNELPNLLYLF